MECPVQRIEVITGEHKRRHYTPEEKVRFVALAMHPGYTISLVARQYGITPSLLFKWKRLMNDGGKSAIAGGDEVVSVSQKGHEKKCNRVYMSISFKKKFRTVHFWVFPDHGGRLRSPCLTCRNGTSPPL